MSDADAMWTCSRCFPCCSRPSSTSARGSKGTDVGHDCIGDFVAGDACIGGACDTGTCIGSACVDSVSAVERSGMHSQSFRNLEVGGARLEIRVGAGCACIESACVGRNLEVGGTGLEIRVGAGCACIEAAGIGSTCTRDTCARGTCAGNASSAVSACIKGAGVGSAAILCLLTA